MKRHSFCSDRGYNLIEAALVLGIAGLVIGAVFAAWGAVSSQNKVRKAEDQITLIVSQIRSTYGNRTQLDAVSGQAFTDALVNAALLPESWVENMAGTNQLSNPYGGNILITPDTFSGGGVNDGINISLSHVGKPDCLKLVSNTVGLARSQGLYKVDGATVNSASAFKDISGSVCNGSPVSFYFSLKINS